jgi:hypothetical protein
MRFNAMKTIPPSVVTKLIFCFFLLFFYLNGGAQNSTKAKPKSEFWNKVQFGGGLNLAFGNDFTNVGIAPTAIYNVNKYVAIGTGLQYNYLKQQDFFSSQTYGVSILSLVNPSEFVQLSIEMEQLRVNIESDQSIFRNDTFWNTGLFLGAGYRYEEVTFGFRYNVLYQADQGVYGDAFMPFVRVFF